MTATTTAPIRIDVEKALNLLEQAVQERGEDYVYQPIPDLRVDPIYPDEVDTRCVYVNNGAPSCLVGLALHKGGVPLSVLEDHNDMGAGALLDLLAKDGIVVKEGDTRLVGGVLTAAQSVQDGGVRTWKDAYYTAKAKAYLGRDESFLTPDGNILIWRLY